MDNQKSIPKGILGALIGAIPGVILWLILGKIGIIASICGIVILVGVVVGYTALGKELDKTGVIICIAVVIISIYFATSLNWASQIHKAFDGSYSLFWCMRHLGTILDIAGCKGKFILDLIIGYVITAIGIGSYLKKSSSRH